MNLERLVRGRGRVENAAAVAAFAGGVRGTHRETHCTEDLAAYPPRAHGGCQRRMELDGPSMTTSIANLTAGRRKTIRLQ